MVATREQVNDESQEGRDDESTTCFRRFSSVTSSFFHFRLGHLGTVEEAQGMQINIRKKLANTK